MLPNSTGQTERLLRESEQLFRLVADAAPVLVWMSATDKRCTYFNKPWLDFTGRSMEEEIGNGRAEGVHPEDSHRCSVTYAQSFDRREEFRMEVRLRRHDGEYRWILDIGVPRFNHDGSFSGYMALVSMCMIVGWPRKSFMNTNKRSRGSIRSSRSSTASIAIGSPIACI